MVVASPPTDLAAALQRVDDLADKSFAGWHVPGVAYGVVLGTELIHSRGLGTLRVGEDATPTASSVFRIASMTKSFTAATVLSLRDEGRLRLDDPIAGYVPELASLRYPSTDSPPITIRHLLTMTAGFPTDDPWGDRQQGLDLGEFSRLLAGGLSFAWAPGTRFEYSNTGYGILGRLITNVAGREYRDVVCERILGPLGMTSSAYLEAEVPTERKASGYVWRDARYLEEPIDGYGALASMGGIFTTVEDLAKWVGGFLDAVPRDGPEGPHPLRRASRREMQQPMVPAGFRVSQASADAVPEVELMSYGFGLFMVDDARIGRIVGHGGGYPGFGTGMRWHPASGLGVIALTNHRYGPGVPLARDLLNELLRAEVAPVRRIRPNSATERAREAVEALIADWDEARAAELFAMNVELDEPIKERRAFLDRIRERHGPLLRDDSEPTESLSPFHLAWWMTGRSGRVRIEILLSPELPPKIQTFAVTSVPEPPARLRTAAERIVAALQPAGTTTGPITIDWPADLTVGAAVDLGAVVRAMRATEARLAPVRLGPPVAGDGETKATFRLDSPRGRIDLVLELDPAIDCLSIVSLVPARLVPPDLD
jgi:Beta-lactamase class C and other penicillin binding proteins